MWRALRCVECLEIGVSRADYDKSTQSWGVTIASQPSASYLFQSGVPVDTTMVGQPA